jgi:predicted nuclease of restriction endonuclease-like (RecB) superfamily
MPPILHGVIREGRWPFSATGSGSLPASGGYGLSAEAQLHPYALIRNIQGGKRIAAGSKRGRKPTPAKHVGKLMRPLVYDKDWKTSDDLKTPINEGERHEEGRSGVLRSGQADCRLQGEGIPSCQYGTDRSLLEYRCHDQQEDRNVGVGDGVVERLAQFMARTEPGLRGFTPRNLFRMRQFYEAYKEDSIVTPLVTQLPWSHHLIILGQSKRVEEREFYIRMAIRERWSRRELERQFNSALFERVILHPPKVTPLVTQRYPDAINVFRDAYAVEFLDLPPSHAEADLHRGLLEKLKNFLIELGRDFCFVGSEYPLQVGNRDFALDLLFFHRGLNCLVAIELKVSEFEPEFLGKLDFYLEALDRDVRKSHEQPSIGVLLCASKNDEVVEYALSRSLSPTLIAQYETQLPDKKLLQAKLHEFYLQNDVESKSRLGKRSLRTKKL